MEGSLALVGSGEYLPAMTAFEKSLLDDGIKNGKANHYIQIPTAAGRESDERLAYWKELGQRQADAIGVRATFLPIFTREDAFKQEHVDAISNSALMYMSGGDPHYLAEVLIDTPVWAAIGLNLLPEIRVIPHFNKFFKWIPESAAKLLLHVPSDAILIGVDELTAIVKRSGSAHWVVVGEARVHVLKGLPDQQLHDGQEINLTLR